MQETSAMTGTAAILSAAESLLGRIACLCEAVCPDVPGAVLRGAAASALGMPSHDALAACLLQASSGLSGRFDREAFSARLVEAGEAPPEPQILEDLWLDVSKAVTDWLFSHEGAVDAGALDATFARARRNAGRREREAVARLAARGIPPAPRPDAHGGYPGSLTWSLAWLEDAPAGLAVSLRLHVPLDRNADPAGRRRFGWGRAWPDYGVDVRARSMLDALGGGWLGQCVQPFRGNPASIPADLRPALAREGEAPALLEAPAPFGFSLEEDGLHAASGADRFSPGSETILAVEALLMLGDALAEGISARAAGAPDLQAAARWREDRATDGFRPLRQDDWQVADADHVRAVASWTAARIGLGEETYVRAALWGAASHVLQSDGFRRGSTIAGYDGLHAAAADLLPDEDGVERMVAEAYRCDPTAQEMGGGLEGWRSRALDCLNTDAWPAAYYRRWPERRAMTAVEMAAERRGTPEEAGLIHWSALVGRTLAQGGVLGSLGKAESILS